MTVLFLALVAVASWLYAGHRIKVTRRREAEQFGLTWNVNGTMRVGRSTYEQARDDYLTLEDAKYDDFPRTLP